MQLPGAFRRLRVLHRQLVPRHSPRTLSSFSKATLQCARCMLPLSLCNCQSALHRPPIRAGPFSRRQLEMIPPSRRAVKGPRRFRRRVSVFQPEWPSLNIDRPTKSPGQRRLRPQPECSLDPRKGRRTAYLRRRRASATSARPRPAIVVGSGTTEPSMRYAGMLAYAKVDPCPKPWPGFA